VEKLWKYSHKTYLVTIPCFWVDPVTFFPFAR